MHGGHLAFAPPPVAVEIPELDLVTAGAVALILIYGLYILTGLLAGAFSHVPFIGGWISGGLSDVMTAERNALEWSMGHVISGIGSLFHGVTSIFSDLHADIGNALWSIDGALHHIAWNILPGLRADLLNDITAVRKDAWQYAQQARADAWAYSQAVLALAYARIALIRVQLLADIETVRKDAWDYAQAALHDAYARAELVRADAWQYSRDALAQALTRAEAVRVLAFSYAQAAGHAARVDAVGDVDAEISEVVGTVWAGIYDEVKDGIDTVGTTWPELTHLLQDVPAVAGVTAGAAVGALASLLPPLLKTMDDCVIPQCQNLGGLSNFLHSLLGAGVDLALLAWLIFIITEPADAANDTADVAIPLITPIGDALTFLLQVP